LFNIAGVFTVAIQAAFSIQSERRFLACRSIN